jgi:UPF0271 protein
VSWRALLELKVDINCDLGESYGAYTIGNDEELMPHISSANIACGFHAGDPMTMAKTVRLAGEFGIAIGAHPSFPDLMGFGRRNMQLTTEETTNYVIYQVGALQVFAKTVGLSLQHVKPHGALYNMAVREEETSKAIATATKALADDLIIFALPKSMLAKAAKKVGLRVACEFFADRSYGLGGGLVPRQQINSIINEPLKVVERTVKAVVEGTVATNNGELKIGEVHTICVHGDTPNAAMLVKALRKGLDKAHIKVESVGKFL